MPRWGWIIAISVAFCVSCVVLGYFVFGAAIENVVDKGQANVSEQMSESIATSVDAAVGQPVNWPHHLAIRESELIVNNAIVFDEAGIEAGIETGTDGTVIYGFVTEIGPEGISLLAGDAVAYSGIPVVRDGKIDMTEVEAASPIFKFFLTATGFEQAMENGINRALEANGMVPVSVTLSNGHLIIVVEPVPS